MHYILDTYAWIEYFKGTSKGLVVKNVIENNQNFLITLENCIAEICQWCLEENIDFSKILNIIDINSKIELIHLEDWINAAKIKFDKRKTIKNFGLMDALILEKQRKLKCKIITGDQHFKNLKNIVFLN